MKNKKATHNILSDVDSFQGGKLDEKTLIAAIDMLKYGDRQVSFPEVDEANASWQLAMAMAFLYMFRIRLSSSSISYVRNSAMFNMTVPLGRHSIQSQQQITLDEILYHKPSDENNALRTKYEVAKALIQRSLDPVGTWIDIAKNGTTYTVKNILALNNIEQRMAALKIMGADRLLQEAHAELVCKSERGNELYKIPKESGIFSEDAYFLKYACVSTGRIYVSGVPPQLFNLQKTIMGSLDSAFLNDLGALQFFGASTTLRQRGPIDIEAKYYKEYPKAAWADLAMAWKFRLSYEQYIALNPLNEG